MTLLSGQKIGLPYSLSRWTDVPISKWPWFRQQLSQGWMEALDPSGIPQTWSLAPQDTCGLLFWTKDPRNIIRDKDLLSPYRMKVHVTVTGWSEVERGAPDIILGTEVLCQALEVFGPENVTWRFSPIPLVPDVLARFRYILERAVKFGLSQVFVSFLQENDRLPETRNTFERVELLKSLGRLAYSKGAKVRLCYDDFELHYTESPGLSLGVCAPPEDWDAPNPSLEGCGCIKAIDPFTLTEACSCSCTYCYVGDKQVSPVKRNTTRLVVLP